MKDIPYGKLLFLKDKIGIHDHELDMLDTYREVFVRGKDAFADVFHDFFSHIPETGKILEHFEPPGYLKKVWAHWFESLFRRHLDEQYLGYLWRIGVRHVEVNLDQRFSNIGFSWCRQFCQDIINSEIPQEVRIDVSSAIDKLIDYCILVETTAYIEASTHCDTEIIKGVEDRVRNRIAVIGGNIMRLQKKIDRNDPRYPIYESLLLESSSCENLVRDIKTYIEVSEQEQHVQDLSLEELINGSLQALRATEIFPGVGIDVRLDGGEPSVLGDRKTLEHMFYYLLENCLEAVDPEDPSVRISSYRNPALPHRIHVELFNTGRSPHREDIPKLFSPFYSTKTFGTGFGLPIAKLAARKNYGKLEFRPVEGKGTSVIVTLPLSE